MLIPHEPPPHLSRRHPVTALHRHRYHSEFNQSGHYRPQDFIYANSAEGIWGVDYRAGVWHTLLALAPDTVIFEVKPGPYDAATDKEFAPWAPPEGDPRAHAYLIQLEDQFRQHFSLPER